MPRRQVVAAVLAGIFGHALFALGWLILSLEFLIVPLFAVFSLGFPFSEAFSAMFGEIRMMVGFVFWEVNSLGGNLVIFGGNVLAIVGILISALILRLGQVRRPWATTCKAIGIAAIIDVPSLFLYALTFPGDDHPGFFVMAIIGTFAVGILVWLGVTRRSGGSAFEVAGPSTTASGAAAVAATEHAETTSAETTRSTT